MSHETDGTIDSVASGEPTAADPRLADPSTADPSTANPEPALSAPAEVGELVDTPENIGADSEHDETRDAQDAQDDDTSPEAESQAVGSETTAGPAGKKSNRKASLEAEGDVAADFLEGLLDICDIDGDIEVDIDGDRAAVSIVDSEEGRVPRRLVGPDGKVLDSLQELTRLAVQTETGERSRLMLDVAGHRAARKAEIIDIARSVIEDVKSSGDQIEMDPMTAFERKIVHDQVLAAGLRSESDGVEPRRFVVVLPGD